MRQEDPTTLSVDDKTREQAQDPAIGCRVKRVSDRWLPGQLGTIIDPPLTIDLVMVALGHGGVMSFKDIRDACDRSATMVRAKINRLIDWGRVERVGRGRYRATDSRLPGRPAGNARTARTISPGATRGAGARKKRCPTTAQARAIVRKARLTEAEHQSLSRYVQKQEAQLGEDAARLMLAVALAVQLDIDDDAAEALAKRYAFGPGLDALAGDA